MKPFAKAAYTPVLTPVAVHLVYKVCIRENSIKLYVIAYKSSIFISNNI